MSPAHVYVIIARPERHLRAAAVEGDRGDATIGRWQDDKGDDEEDHGDGEGERREDGQYQGDNDDDDDDADSDHDKDKQPGPEGRLKRRG